MPLLPADADSAIAGFSEDSAEYRYASMVDDPDNVGAGILKISSGAVPTVDSTTGAMATEFRGSYDDYEGKVDDISAGSPATLFSIGASGRTKAIKRVVAEFSVADGTNVFEVVVERTVGGDTRSFILFAMNDVANKINFHVEGHALIRPNDTVKIVYAGPGGNDLWYSVTTLDV